MALNLEYYRAFYCAAKAGSYSKAAETLCVTQSAVSQSVHRLEAQLGVSLFRRVSHGMALTNEGEQLLPHVEAALSSVEAGERKLKRIRDLAEGEITIGATESGLTHYLLPRLPVFQSRYPNIGIRIKGSQSKELLDMLKLGTIDLALGVTPISADLPFSITYLREFQDVFFAGSNFWELRGKVIEPKALLHYPLVAASAGSSFSDNLSAWFNQWGARFSPQISVLTTTFVLPFVQSGIAVGCAPDLFVDRWVSGGDLFRIHLAENPPKRKIFLATNPELPLSAASQEFIRLLQNRDLL